MCVTRTRLEEASSQTHQSEKVDHIGAYTSVVTGGRNSGFENSVKKRDLLLKEGLEATKRWRNNIKDAIATYLNSSQHKSIMLVLTMCNIMTLALYGTGSWNKGDGSFEFMLDVVSVTFMVVFFLEIGFRILCFGWKDFWYVNDDFFQQCTNRFDFRVNGLTLFVAAIAVITKISQNKKLWFDPWKKPNSDGSITSNDWTRLVLALPLLRAFSTIRLIRDIVMGMITVFPQYVHVFVLLVMTFYFYACLGCLLFASEFKYNQSYEIPDANFNSMLDSIITLFQLFVGEAWNDVLQAALNTGKTVQALSYFISYSIIMTMLFTNLVIGIICSGYESISDVRKEQIKEGGIGAKISVAEITAALREGETTKRRLNLEYNMRGAIHLRRSPQFQKEGDGIEVEEKHLYTMAEMVAAKSATRNIQRLSGRSGKKETL